MREPTEGGRLTVIRSQRFITSCRYCPPGSSTFQIVEDRPVYVPSEGNGIDKDEDPPPPPRASGNMYCCHRCAARKFRVELHMVRL